MSDAAHPVKLNDHIFGPIIKEVHWTSAPIVVFELSGPDLFLQGRATADGDSLNFADPPASPGLIDPATYTTFAQYAPGLIFIISHNVVINFVVRDTNGVFAINEFIDEVRVSVLINFAHCTFAQTEIFGRIGNSVVIGTGVLVREVFPLSVHVSAKAYSPNAIFTLNADGSISGSGSTLWTYSADIPSAIGLTNTQFEFSTTGDPVFINFNRNGFAGNDQFP